MEVRFFRDAWHPDFQMEIRLKMEDAGLDLRALDAVTGLIEHYGWSIAKAIAAVKLALKP